MGDVIYEHCLKDAPYPTYSQLLNLAHDVYSDVSAHAEAMLCFVKQSRFDLAIHYAVVTEGCTCQHLVEVYITIYLLVQGGPK